MGFEEEMRRRFGYGCRYIDAHVSARCLCGGKEKWEKCMSGGRGRERGNRTCTTDEVLWPSSHECLFAIGEQQLQYRFSRYSSTSSSSRPTRLVPRVSARASSKVSSISKISSMMAQGAVKERKTGSRWTCLVLGVGRDELAVEMCVQHCAPWCV